MSDAPETIWARVYNHSFPYGGGVYWDCEKHGNYQEYRRADLPLTTDQIMSDPRVKALVEARKAYLAAIETYNANLDILRVARATDAWSMDVNQEFAAPDDARKQFIRAAESFCDSAIEESKE